MSEPTRWLDDDGAPREVIDALRSMEPPKPPPPWMHNRLASRFAEATRPRATFAGLFGSKIARLSAGVLLGGGVVFAAARGPLARKAVPVTAPVEVANHVALDRAPVHALPAIPAPVADPPGAPSAEPTGVGTHAPAPAARRPGSSDTLAEEEAILEGARRAVATSPERALRLLSIHQRRFPAGELTAERMFLRTDALRRLGRTEDARRQADALVKRFPTSAYARLVPALIGSATAP